MYIHSFHVTLYGRTPAAQHTHDNHEIYYCLDGNCMQTAADASFPMEAGDLCLFPQGVPHYAYACGGASSSAWVINVDDEFLSARQDGDREAREILQIFRRRALAGNYQLAMTAAGRQLAQEAVAAMVAENTAHRPGWQTVQKLEFMRLLCGLYREWPADSPLPSALPEYERKARMRDVFAFIDNNYMNPLMVDDLLPLAHLGRSQFHAVFAAEAGCPFKTYLNRLRTAQAARLLQESDLPIVQIALGCGFNCLSHFYAVFKAITGEAPRRQRVHGNLQTQ